MLRQSLVGLAVLAMVATMFLELPLAEASAPAPIRVTINGTPLSMDVAPTIQNGRTLVPMRAIFEALGASVHWDEATGTIRAYRREDAIVLQLENRTAWVNGPSRQLDVAPVAVGGRTMVPLRFVAEALGAEVAWVDATRTITVQHTPYTPRHIGGTITIGALSVPVILNPILSFDAAASDVHGWTNWGLVRTAADLTMRNSIADRWVWDHANLTWTFWLRPDVRFSDGQPLAASDVKFTFDTIMHPDYDGPHGQTMEHVAEITTEGDHIVRFRMRQVDATFLANIGLGIIPHHILGHVPVREHRAHAFSRQPIGAGPYLLERITPRQSAMLRRNSHFWIAPRPYIETIVIRRYGDLNAMQAALAAGEIDWFSLMPDAVHRMRRELAGRVGATALDVSAPARAAIAAQLQARLRALTEAGDFAAVVSLLDTPEKLVEYMIRHFRHYVEVIGRPAEHYRPKLPEYFFTVRVGSCEDFSQFGAHVLDHHGYEVWTLYTLGQFATPCPLYGHMFGHTVILFRDHAARLRYITNVVGPDGRTSFRIFGPFDSIQQVIASEEARTRVKIFLHGFTHQGSIGEQMKPGSFPEAVTQLNTVPRILNWMARNVRWRQGPPRPVQTPEQLFQSREGIPSDFAVFISYLMSRHGYQAQVLRLEVAVDGATLYHNFKVIFLDKDSKLRLLSHYGKHTKWVSQAYDSLDDALRHYQEVNSMRRRAAVMVLRYGLIEPGVTNLVPRERVVFPGDAAAAQLQARLRALTEAGDFAAVVSLLDTPEKLVEYMIRHFRHYVEVIGRPLGYYKPYLPEDFFTVRVGSCDDFSQFGAHVLDHHGFEVWTLYTFGKFATPCPLYGNVFGHTVTVFRDQAARLRYITNVAGPDGRTSFRIFGPFDSIQQVIASEEARTRVKIFLHGFTHQGSIGEQMKPGSFPEAVAQLNTVPRILNWMARNVRIRWGRTDPVMAPGQFFQSREGTLADFVVFISYLMSRHGYKAQVLRLEVSVEGATPYHDFMVVFLDKNSELRIMSLHGKHIMRVSQAYASLDDFLKTYQEMASLQRRATVRVVRFGLIEPGTTNLVPRERVVFPRDTVAEQLQARLRALTEAGDFAGVVRLLDTPEKLVEYMTRHFRDYVGVFGRPPEHYRPTLPESFFTVRVGMSEDFSQFGAHVLDHHGFEVWTFYMLGRVTAPGPSYGRASGHTAILFRDRAAKFRYITSASNPDGQTSFTISGPFDSIEQVIASEEARTRVKILLHGFTHLGSIGDQMKPGSFPEAVAQLNTVPRILNWMARNVRLRRGRLDQVLAPAQFFQSREGHLADFVVFASYLMSRHGYKAQVLRIEAAVDGATPYLNFKVVFTDKTSRLRIISHHGEHIMRMSQVYASLDDALRHYQEVASLQRRAAVRVVRFGLIEPGTTNLVPREWVVFPR